MQGCLANPRKQLIRLDDERWLRHFEAIDLSEAYSFSNARKRVKLHVAVCRQDIFISKAISLLSTPQPLRKNYNNPFPKHFEKFSEGQYYLFHPVHTVLSSLLHNVETKLESRGKSPNRQQPQTPISKPQVAAIEACQLII